MQHPKAQVSEKTKKECDQTILSGGSASYEKVGFFSRTLNILCILSALFVLVMGVLKVLGESGINIDSSVKLIGIEFLFSVGVMLLLQSFVAFIWLLCFNKPARIGVVLFLVFLLASFIFNNLLSNTPSSGMSRLIIGFSLNVGIFGSLMTVSFSEQHLKNTRGFALFFGLLYIFAEAFAVIFALKVITLPTQVPIGTAVAVAKIFATIAYVIMFLCLNTLWKRRKVKNK